MKTSDKIACLVLLPVGVVGVAVFAMALTKSQRVDKAHWREANSANTVGGYKRYVELHGQGRFVAQAVGKIEALEWETAASADTVKSYKRYLETYQEGKYVSDALKGISSASKAARVKLLADMKASAETEQRVAGIPLNEAIELLESIDGDANVNLDGGRQSFDVLEIKTFSSHFDKKRLIEDYGLPNEIVEEIIIESERVEIGRLKLPKIGGTGGDVVDHGPITTEVPKSVPCENLDYDWLRVRVKKGGWFGGRGKITHVGRIFRPGPRRFIVERQVPGGKGLEGCEGWWTGPPPARSLSRPAAVRSRPGRKPISYQANPLPPDP